MARYTDDSRDRVRQAVDFVDLVGSRVELRKAGVRRYTGLCPFHEERSPSFGIDPLEKLYHCFGCGVGGDVFKWVMETENVGFGEALEILADRYNVQLERTEEDPGAAERRARDKRLMALLERAAGYYVRLLWESPEAAGARQYLVDRGLAEPTCREFRVGFSSGAWDRVVAASQRAGYTEAELLAVGLAQPSRGRSGLIDRFRGRLMFPWADERGRVLGFGARALEADQQPKYLNTSETDIFRKGRQVYGADIARTPAAKAGSVVLVEGYTDVIAFHQAGIRQTVGQQGTALTSDQAGALSRLASRIVLCLDADAAGQAAMLKAAAVIRSVKRDADVRVVALPAGSDPADVVAAQGAEAVQGMLDRAVPFAKWQVQRLLAQDERGDELLSEVAAVVNSQPRGLLRDELTRDVAGAFGLSESLMAEMLTQAPPPAPRPRAPVRPQVPRPTPDLGGTFGGGDDEDPGLAALLAADPGREGDAAPVQSRSRGPATVTSRTLDRRAETELAYLALCVALPAAGARRLGEADIATLFSSPLVRRAAEHLRTHADSPSSGLEPDDEALAGLIAELVLRAGAHESPDPGELDRAGLMLELARLDRDIAAARATQSPLSDLAAERQRVLGEIRKVAH